ncbi:hypothetical protein GCM10008983_05160 [Lentibacillus halophilus]|uniref:Glutaredoxin domain-containing protein n=1 Tax=Lentibacillus halophilus TaxID=295065 RepID=A0ABN0Z3I6_9BACI
MNNQKVVVYISDANNDCKQLLSQLDYCQIDYETKNITQHKDHMEQLQENGIFGTPATFVNDRLILGRQINTIKYELGLKQHESYGRASNG